MVLLVSRVARRAVVLLGQCVRRALRFRLDRRAGLPYRRAAAERAALLAVCTLFLLLTGAARAQESLLSQLLPAEQGAAAGAFRVEARVRPAGQRPGLRASAEVAFSCQPQYYVWHDSIKVDLVSVLTGGRPARDITAGPLVMPEPKQKYDEFAGDVVKYLDGDFTVNLLLAVAPDARPGSYDLVFDIRYTGCGPNVCQFGKASAALRLEVLAGPLVVRSPGQVPKLGQAARRAASVKLEAPSAFSGRGPLLAILIAFVGGLGLTFTPCVYPLIPVVISLIGATTAGRKLDALVRSLVYVLGIAVTYSVAGVAAAATGGVFGAWLQHPAIYLALSALFVALAGAMFDFYSIELVSQRVQRLQAWLRGRAGLVGIWAIGLLSGAAATACIAPVISGALLYVAQSRDLVLGWLMFFAMACGMGAPLVLLGTFSGLVRSLPKSGEWMVLVKRAFGLALLAVAVYYVGKSRLLGDVWFGAFVVVFLVGLGVLWAVLLARRVGARRLAWLNGIVGILLIAVGAVLLLRWLGAPAAGTEPERRAAIEWLASEEKALAAAWSEGRPVGGDALMAVRPVLLDFWADWCAPCRRMAETTFADEGVVAESKRFVCAKLDVSDPSDPAVQALLEKYDILGVPTVVTISTAGEARMHVGYIGPDDMLRLLRSVQ